MSNLKKRRVTTKGDLVYESLQHKALYGEKEQKVQQENSYNEYNKKIDAMYNSRVESFREFKTFKNKVKEDFLSECMYKMFIPAFDKLVESPRKEAICKGLVRDFIKEESCDKLLRKFRKGSPLLYEVYDVTTRYTDMVLEKCDKDDCNTFNVDTEIKDSFFEEIDASSSFNAVSDTLNSRISAALDEFIMDNIETKSQIKDIITQTKERVDRNRNKKVQEACNNLATSRIHDLKQTRSKGVFECMVHNIIESCFVDSAIKDIYYENNKLNMDKVVEETALLYGFLEMVNLCYMKKVDDDYLLDNINGLKK